MISAHIEVGFAGIGLALFGVAVAWAIDKIDSCETKRNAVKVQAEREALLDGAQTSTNPAVAIAAYEALSMGRMPPKAAPRETLRSVAIVLVPLGAVILFVAFMTM